MLARLEARITGLGDAVELQIERAHFLAELGRGKEAAQVYAAAHRVRPPKYPLTTRAYSTLPFRGRTLPISALLLVAPEWGNAPFRKYLDEQTFLTLHVIADFHDHDLPLPPHHLVINAISDADFCPASLEAAAKIVAKSSAPCVNPPSQVLTTTREENSRRLGAIAGVRTPRITTLAREFFAASDAAANLRAKGFTFPLLVRAPGYHTGQHFVRVESERELPAVITLLPGDRISVIEFLDARSNDGLIRKYRVMSIGGQLFPAHAAVARDWKVHLFSSSAPEHAEARAEDRNFLENMEQVLGPRAMETLRRVQAALNLDYFGIDFSLGANGDVMIYEANATMNVPPPEVGELWDYRRAATQRISDAIRGLFFAKAFARPGAAAGSPTQVLREFTLRRIEDHLACEPGRVDLAIERAKLLIELERFEEAKDIYLAILAKDPTQFVALNNLGTLLRAMGFHKAALKVHREVVARIPDDVKARVNLANSLRECGELDEARANYETVLRAKPDHTEAHRGLAYVLMYLREKVAAREHRRLALQGRPEPVPVWRGPEGTPRALVFVSPCGGNSPITRILGKAKLQACHIVPDFHDPSTPLPAHDVVVNAVGDADQCGTSLEALPALLAKTSRPVLNRPECVLPTGRADNARLLGQLQDVVTPKIIELPREVLAGREGVARLEREGLTFPLLLRSPGFHEGSHFVRAEKADDLAGVAARLPGQNLLAIEYLDARDGDGKVRKFRAMMIDGRLYPLHKAVAREWMIHYATAEMAHSAEHRAEDAAYLEDMAGVLGPRAMAALERIRAALGLDYAGADFSLGRNGEVLLFEANATMSVPAPEKGAQWDFRRPAVERIQAAVREMIFARAKAA
jgi:tetratricopeptide (TPR) repeat protein